MTDTSHPVDLLPELALGILPEDDRTTVEQHVSRCPACREEFAAMARAVAALPLAAEESSPSPALKEAVMARLQLSEPESRPAMQVHAEGPKLLPERPAGANIIRPARWAWMVPVAAAAAALLVGAFGGYLVRGGGGGGADADFERVAAINAGAVESAAKGELRVSRGELGSVKVALVRTAGGANAYVHAEGMPPLPEGKAYQAWFTKDGKTFEPSDTFTNPGGGTWVPANGAVEGYAAMGLTIEDADGVDAPTQAPFVVIDLSRSARLIVR